MKKILYGTTALVAAGLIAGAAPARADDKPIQVTIGGYFYTFFTGVTQNSHDGAAAGTNAAGLGASGVGTASTLNNKDIKEKSRIQFDGRTQLDNGLVAGFRVQLRGLTGANTAGTGATGAGQATEDQIDEHFLFLDSPTYGRMEAGGTASAPRKMWYGAITPAMPVHGLNSPNFLESANNFQPSTLISFGGNTDRAEKVQYFTPRIAGFQLGASYAPDTCDYGDTGPAVAGGVTIPVCNFNDGTNLRNLSGQETNLWSGAINYVNKFGDLDVGIYAGGETATVQPVVGAPLVAKSNRTQLGTGFRLSWNGFSGGLSYRFDNEGVNAAVPGATAGVIGTAKNRHDAHVGISYGQGPWSVGTSFAYMHEDRINATAGTIGHDVGTWEAVGANYALGPGININTAVERADVTGGALVTGVTSDHAWIYTIGTVLNF